MLMISDGTNVLDPEEAVKELPKILRNRPQAFLDRYKFVTPRGSGKTTSAILIVHAILSAIGGHASRMRGRYVHARKGKYQRRHKQRVSWLDTRQEVL